MRAACHRRVERQCATLLRLAPHLAEHGADQQARKAAWAVMRYFDTAARDHHEEEDLFPALFEAVAGSDAVCIREMTRALIAEHRQLERNWTTLRRALVRVASGLADSLPLTELQAFVDLYERHIAFEEAELLSMVHRLLPESELDRVGRAMLDRRGITDEGLAAAPML